MPAVLVLKANDTLPALNVQLSDGGGDYAIPVGSTVRVLIRGTNGTLYAGAETCSVINAATGIISYDRSGDEGITPGQYLFEFEVVLPAAGGVRTFPSNSYLPVTIIRDLN